MVHELKRTVIQFASRFLIQIFWCCWNQIWLKQDISGYITRMVTFWAYLLKLLSNWNLRIVSKSVWLQNIIEVWVYLDFWKKIRIIGTIAMTVSWTIRALFSNWLTISTYCLSVGADVLVVPVEVVIVKNVYKNRRIFNTNDQLIIQYNRATNVKLQHQAVDEKWKLISQFEKKWPDWSPNGHWSYVICTKNLLQ